MQEEIILTRDCEAIRIPQGTPVTLSKGARVVITQSLGGSYTVATDMGLLVRIIDRDADALGFEVPEAPEKPVAFDGKVDEKLIWDQLRTCYDPEIPVNIVDLGLIYDCALKPRESEPGMAVTVKMTLTAPGCGMGPTLAAEAESKLVAIPGIEEATVELVWDPPWNQSMISEAGQMKLGLI